MRLMFVGIDLPACAERVAAGRRVDPGWNDTEVIPYRNAKDGVVGIDVPVDP